MGFEPKKNKGKRPLVKGDEKLAKRPKIGTERIKRKNKGREEELEELFDLDSDNSYAFERSNSSDEDIVHHKGKVERGRISRSTSKGKMVYSDDEESDDYDEVEINRRLFKMKKLKANVKKYKISQKLKHHSRKLVDSNNEEGSESENVESFDEDVLKNQFKSQKNTKFIHDLKDPVDDEDEEVNSDENKRIKKKVSKQRATFVVQQQREQKFELGQASKKATDRRKGWASIKLVESGRLGSKPVKQGTKGEIGASKS